MSFDDLVQGSRAYACEVLKGNKEVLRHTGNVVGLCMNFGKGHDYEVLLVSAYLHDIGIALDQNNHHRKSAELAEKWLRSKGADEDFVQNVIHCIGEHGTSGNPQTPEAILLRQLDGLSQFTNRMSFKETIHYIFKRDLRYEKSKNLSKALEKITEPEFIKMAHRKYLKMKFFAPRVSFSDAWLKSTLKKFADTLTGAEVKYFIIGSSGLKIRGLDVGNTGIDIITSKKGVEIIENNFKDFIQSPVSYVNNDRYRTWFGKFAVNGFDVEVMGDLEMNKEGKWTKPKKPKEFLFPINGTNIILVNLNDELRIYDELGLEIPKERIEKIRNFIQPAKI
jgi:HD superfamily phosphodiesterase